jgi:MYXO-CTERM domain-containing protein
VIGTGGDTGAGAGETPPNPTSTVLGGCSCSFDPAHPAGSSSGFAMSLTGVVGLVLARRRRKRA